MYADEIQKESRNRSNNKFKRNSSGIDGKWKHDLFMKNDQPRRQKVIRKTVPVKNISLSTIRRTPAVSSTTVVVDPESPSTLFISNLASSVSQEDLEELFQEFNPEVVTLHHDASGNSLGTADLVVPSNKVPIIKKKFEGVMLDGQEFNILETNVTKTSVFDRIKKVSRPAFKSALPARVRVTVKPKFGRRFK